MGRDLAAAETPAVLQMLLRVFCVSWGWAPIGLLALRQHKSSEEVYSRDLLCETRYEHDLTLVRYISPPHAAQVLSVQLPLSGLTCYKARAPP